MIRLEDENGTDEYATRGVLFCMPHSRRRVCAEHGHDFGPYIHSRGSTVACSICGLLGVDEV